MVWYPEGAGITMKNRCAILQERIEGVSSGNARQVTRWRNNGISVRDAKLPWRRTCVTLEESPEIRRIGEIENVGDLADRHLRVQQQSPALEEQPLRDDVACRPPGRG